MKFLDDLILGIKDKADVVVLPRDKDQGLHYRGEQFVEVPAWSIRRWISRTSRRTATLFVGAGGTMTREMAVLGVPTVSVYQDELLDVDRYLLEIDAFVHNTRAHGAQVAWRSSTVLRASRQSCVARQGSASLRHGQK